MNKYKIDFTAFIADLAPSFRRSAVILLAYLRAACSHLKKMHDDFIAWGELKQYEILWSAQTISLRRFLRNRYKSEGILIENLTVDTNGVYIGTDVDTPFFIGKESEADLYVGLSYNLDNTNFTVKVPAAVAFDPQVMRAQIEKYKTLGTEFTITTY